MRAIFSEALRQQSDRTCRQKVRPKRICTDAPANEGIEIDGDHEEGEDTIEEGRAILGQKMVYQPSKQEWDDHQRYHIPFREWCPFCVKGKCITGAHRKGQKSQFMWAMKFQ